MEGLTRPVVGLALRVRFANPKLLRAILSNLLSGSHPSFMGPALDKLCQVFGVCAFLYGWGGRIDSARRGPRPAGSLRESKTAPGNFVEPSIRFSSFLYGSSSAQTLSGVRSLCLLVWLGWKDSNLRVTGSKPAALPLGYTPVAVFEALGFTVTVDGRVIGLHLAQQSPLYVTVTV